MKDEIYTENKILKRLNKSISCILNLLPNARKEAHSLRSENHFSEGGMSYPHNPTESEHMSRMYNSSGPMNLSFSDPELLFTTQETKASTSDKFENSAQF